MIELSEPIASYWTGPAERPAELVSIDRFRILRVDHDLSNGTVVITGVYGYERDGQFMAHEQPNGSLNIFSQVLLQGSDYKAFQEATSRKGAPAEDFRIRDIEEVIISRGLVKAK